jgi:hypothetical protein
MRQKKVWRYYCDHCNKGGCVKAAMLKHERHCIRNPERTCRMCALGGGYQELMPVLKAALVEGGDNKLREVASGCPVCMLAAIVQTGPYDADPETGWYEGPNFDYRTESRAYLDRVNELRSEEMPYG